MGRTTKWKGIPKKRCEIEGCKKRARHNMTDGSFVCKKHANEMEEASGVKHWWKQTKKEKNAV